MYKTYDDMFISKGTPEAQEFLDEQLGLANKILSNYYSEIDDLDSLEDTIHDLKEQAMIELDDYDIREDIDNLEAIFLKVEDLI